MSHPLPAGPEPYYAPGWPTTPPRRLDGLAVASFVTSLVGLGLVGIGLGVAALVRIRRRPATGRGLAIAGVVIGGVWTLVQAVVVVSVVSGLLAARPLPLDVTEPVDAPASRLRTGHCLDALPDDGPVGRVRVVPCAQRHAAEVISQYEFPRDAAWPGQGGADARVAAACQLSQAERDAGVRAVTWAPTEESWGEGDRTGLCVAHLEGGFTGSLLDGTADLPVPEGEPGD